MKDLCFNTFQSKILPLIEDENLNQILKWGVQNHNPFQWLAFTTEELGELSKAISEWYFRTGTTEQIIKEAIQTATLAIKIAEMFTAEYTNVR